MQSLRSLILVIMLNSVLFADEMILVNESEGINFHPKLTSFVITSTIYEISSYVFSSTTIGSLVRQAFCFFKFQTGMPENKSIAILMPRNLGSLALRTATNTSLEKQEGILFSITLPKDESAADESGWDQYGDFSPGGTFRKSCE